INIARLILLNYHPDISQGRQSVLALMFDMNKLWEKYMIMLMRRHLGDRFKVGAQKGKVFWQAKNLAKRLKPDILLEKRSNPSEKIVIDTKWKIPSHMEPSDEDLRQMFAYNRLFKCQKSILLYPGA